MTEKKCNERFKHTEITQDDGQTLCYGIEDTERNFVYNVVGEGMYELSEKELIKLLNKQNERIIELSEYTSRLVRKNERLHRDWDKLWEVCLDKGFTEEELIKELER